MPSRRRRGSGQHGAGTAVSGSQWNRIGARRGPADAACFVLAIPGMIVPRIVCSLVIACLAVGCQGVVSEPVPDAPRPGEAGPLPAPRLHRLNRLEYDNTVRDLLGTRLRPSAGFPPDGAAGGLDNLAENLTLTPTLLSAYYDAAKQVVNDALEDQPSFIDRTEAPELPVGGGERVGSFLALRGSALEVRRTVPAGPAGVVLIAGGPLFGQELTGTDLVPRLRFELDGAEVATVAVRGSAGRAVEHVFSVELSEGPHTFRFVPLNYVNDPAVGFGNNINVAAVELRGPIAEAPGRALVYVCEPAPPPAPTLTDVRRHVPNPTVFGTWRFTGDAIEHVADVGGWAPGPPLPARPRLFQTPGDPRVFIIDVDPAGTEMKRHILSPQSLGSWLFGGGDIEPLSAAERDALPDGPSWPQTRRLVQQQGAPEVYIVDVAAEPIDPSAYDAACYREIVTTFAARAWRRPLEDAESDALQALWTELVRDGEHAEAALRLVLRNILIAPAFLYRTYEPERADHWLASRLSYFLWSSAPDEALLEAAASGALRDDEGLRTQVRRMLADPRSRALLDGFAEQWLSTRRLAQWMPNQELFPDAQDPALRKAMEDESKAFFGAFLGRDRPALGLLEADFAVLNDRLAAHYGVEPVGSEAMVEVPASQGRGSVLGLSAWLSLHSDGEDSSPIQRGRWLSDHILCAPVPPPPAGFDVGQLETGEEGLTKREQLELHRDDPLCAGCHERLDVVGMGFELYDALARQRSDPGLDTLGQMPNGETFEGAEGLAAAIDPHEFASCLTQWLYMYAVGRAVVRGDEARIDAIAAEAIAGGQSIPDILEAIVLSDAFRRGDTGGAP